MAKKIKVTILTPEKKIRLPGVGIKTATRFIRFGLWSTKFFNDSDEDMQKFLVNNKQQIIDFLYLIADELKDYEPFTLVEIQDSENHILIEVK